MGVGRIQWNLGPCDDLQNSGYCDASLHAAGERSPIIWCEMAEVDIQEDFPGFGDNKAVWA